MTAKRKLGFGLLVVGLAALAGLPLATAGSEEPRGAQKRGLGAAEASYSCVWQCNDGTQGGCDPPPEHCWGECGYACQGHGGVEICAIFPMVQ